jgi:hypothetical protein
MKNLVSEYLEEVSKLCFATKEESEIDEKIEDYLKTSPHLRTPAGIDMLRQAVKTWLRIRDLEKLLEKADEMRDKTMILNRIDRMTKTWMTMMANLGLAFTKQQYIKQKHDTVQPPIERLRMLKKKGANENGTA